MHCEWCPKKPCERFPPCFSIFPGRKNLNNPGNLAELHMLANEVKPNVTDGFEVEFKHHFKPHKSIFANWTLSHTRPSGFRFGGRYMMRASNDVLTPLFEADINPSNLAAHFRFLYYPFLPVRFDANFKRLQTDKDLVMEGSLEFKMRSGTLSFDLYDMRQDAGRFTVSYLRAITEHWDLGMEWMAEWPRRYLNTSLALAARYSRHDHAIAATVSTKALDVSYWLRLHKTIQMSTTFAYNPKISKVIGTIAYQWDFDDAIVRGLLDSDFTIGCEYYRSLTFMPMAFNLSLLLGLLDNRFVFGLKMIVDPAGLRQGD